ncbi:MAG: hypothetical protein NTX57_05865, partial [Armatimonadetes bacterium]|nr:hypothetical protein [Armatimonadota bacterium]
VTPDDSAGREVLGQEARDVFALVGEVVASPKGSPELLALALLGYSARSRWRHRGLVRDPYNPEALRLPPAGLMEMGEGGGSEE